GRPARFAGAIRRLRGEQGRDRQLHDRPGQGSGGRGHPGERRATGPDRDRHPCLGRPARARARVDAPGADATRRQRRRGGAGHRLAALGGRQLHHHVPARSIGSALMTVDIKPLVALLAIVNPLAAVPFFIHYTQGYGRRQRQRTIWISSFSAFVVIAVSALLGLQILQFFNISLASFQVGGGMLLLTSSLSMLNAQPAEAKSTPTELSHAAERAAVGASIAVVPLTIPLLTGPATMSTVVIYADKAHNFLQILTLVGYGLVIGLVTAL